MPNYHDELIKILSSPETTPEKKRYGKGRFINFRLGVAKCIKKLNTALCKKTRTQTP